VTHGREGSVQRTVATRPAGIKRVWVASSRSRRTRGRRSVVGAILMLAAVAPPARGQAPDEHWRSLRTDHFRLTFPERLEPLARRAGAYAERAWVQLSEAFVAPPRGLIDLVVTDHTDVSNGFARLTPSNRITVYANPPVDDPALGFFDEWMELVITHELAHVFHLDRTGFLGRIGRSVFGRVPTTWPIFPGMDVPRWTTEGLATWYESSLTDAGRVHGTYHDMVVRTAAWEDRFDDFDQVAGDSPVWPDGDRAYTFGSLFFEWLLEEHGEERMGTFADAVAGQWIPYRLDAAGRHGFGAPLSREWTRWTAARRAMAQATAAELARERPLSEPERLTHGARYGLYAKVSREGDALAYTRADGRSDSRIHRTDAAGSGSTTDLRTNGVSNFDWLPGGGWVFAQMERSGPYRAYRDLWTADPRGGGRRVTRGARLDHPSASPDGAWAVAVQAGDGTNGLVRVDLRSGALDELVPTDPAVHWTFPAVSPDGRWIAVSRWTHGAYLDVVVLDLTGTVVLEVTRDRAMDLAPAWSPDGRRLLWGSDRTGIPNVLAAEVDPLARTVGPILQVTNVVTGAGYPSVDSQGRWVTFSGYHADGWEIERIPYRPDTWTAAPDPIARFTPAPARTLDAVDGQVRPYSALPTLLPRYWEPTYQEPLRTVEIRSGDLVIPGRQVLGAAIGAQTSGVDAVGRHEYDAFARAYTTGGVVDAGLAYGFNGLGNPVFALGASQVWDEDGPRLARPSDTEPFDTLFVRVRERNVIASATVRRSRWRDVASLTFSGGVTWEHRQLLDNDLRPSASYSLTRPDARFSDLRTTIVFSTARGHAFQTGASDGFTVVVRGRRKNELGLADSLLSRPGVDRSLEEVVGNVRAYRSLGGPGHAAHVLAFRVSGGAARGAGAGASHFEVGGASGVPEDVTGLTLFGGTPLLFPVRGYPRVTRFGRRAWSASVEYRFPLLLVNQGLGPWPLHLDRIIGSIFADAGNAWGPELGLQGYENPRRPMIASVGAEVSAGFLAWWRDGILVRGGIALPLREQRDPEVYVRVGLPF